MTINSREFKKMFVFHHIPINQSSKGLDNSNISQSNIFVLCQKSTKELKVNLNILNYDMQKTGGFFIVRYEHIGISMCLNQDYSLNVLRSGRGFQNVNLFD